MDVKVSLLLVAHDNGKTYVLFDEQHLNDGTLDFVDLPGRLVFAVDNLDISARRLFYFITKIHAIVEPEDQGWVLLRQIKTEIVEGELLIIYGCIIPSRVKVDSDDGYIWIELSELLDKENPHIEVAIKLLKNISFS